MGGCCCCAAKASELSNAPPYYHVTCYFDIGTLPFQLIERADLLLFAGSRKGYKHIEGRNMSYVMCVEFKYPSASVEHVPLSSHHGTVSTHSTGLLVDTNLDTSVPETYIAPPAPVPYETYVGRPRTPPVNRNVVAHKPVEETNSGNTQETAVKDVKSGENAQNNAEATLVKEAVDELENSGELKKPAESIVTFLEEEDVCPTCLEEYDAENPKIITKCEHHFHLACILEWMERSDTCPVCDQEMIFSTANES